MTGANSRFHFICFTRSRGLGKPRCMVLRFKDVYYVHGGDMILGLLKVNINQFNQLNVTLCAMWSSFYISYHFEAASENSCIEHIRTVFIVLVSNYFASFDPVHIWKKCTIFCFAIVYLKRYVRSTDRLIIEAQRSLV